MYWERKEAEGEEEEEDKKAKERGDLRLKSSPPTLEVGKILALGSNDSSKAAAVIVLIRAEAQLL